MKVRALILALALALTPACALLQPAPTVQQQTDIRQQAARLVDAFTVGIGLVDEAGALIDSFDNIPGSTKDRFDCLVKQALGDDAPSATVVRVCRGMISGPILSRADAPVRRAVRVLQTATTDASLKPTVQAALQALQPIWELMKQSENGRVAAFGLVLETSLRPALAYLGG